MSKANLYTRLTGIFSSTQNATKTSIKPIIPKTSSIKPTLPKTSPIKPSKLPKPTKPKTELDTTPSKTLNQKVKELLNEKDSQQLVEKFKYLSQFSYFRSRCREIYKLTIHRLALAQQYPLIEQALESQKEYLSNEGFACRIIYLYGKYGMFDHAYKVFDELPDRKCKPGVQSFTALLGAAANSEKYDMVWDMFQALPMKMSIQPNVDCFNTAMHALCKLGRVGHAVLLLDEMEGDGLKPCVISFNTLLCAYYEAGECAEGDKIWERMVTSNVVPDIRSYNFKLQGLIKNDKLLEALELAMQLKDKGVKPDECTYNAVIQGLIKDDDLVCVKEWYGRLIKSGCKPNRATFSTLVPFLCKKGDYGLAFEVSEFMLKGKNSWIDEAALQKVVDGLAKNSMADKAKVLVELGLSNSYAPYNLVMPDSV